MAAPNISNPFQNKFKSGSQVSNTGGLAQPPAPTFKAPVSNPGVQLGAPGPAPLGGPITTPGAQAANARFNQKQASSRKDVAKFSGQQFGRAGGTETDDPNSLLGQIRGSLTGMFEGGPSKGFIDRSSNALGSAVEGQRAQAVNRIDDDAIRRGLFKSGIPSEQTAAAGNAAQGAFSQGLADILSQAENQDIQGKQFATSQGLGLLGQNRAFDSEMMSRADAARSRGGGQPGTRTIIDPDTGQSYEVSNDVFQYLG